MFRKREDGIKNTMKRGKEDEKADFCVDVMRVHRIRHDGTGERNALQCVFAQSDFKRRRSGSGKNPDETGHAQGCAPIVIPWDDEGTQWSVFIEVENESESKIVLDETWLIACNAEKEEFARWHVPAIGGAFYSTVRVIQPGERVVLFAGAKEIQAYTYDEKRGTTEWKTVGQTGLGEFAGKIRRAKFLRVRLEARIDSQTRGHLEKVTDAKAWIEDGKLHLETAEGLDLSGFGVAERHRQRQGRTYP